MTSYARVVDGVVIECLYDFPVDPNEIFPPEYPWTVIPEGVPVDQGWLYDGETFSEPPPPEPNIEEMTRNALMMIDAQMGYATMQIGRLQDAVDLGIATPEEVALLEQWRLFRIEIGRVPDLPGFPVDFVWPQQPV